MHYRAIAAGLAFSLCAALAHADEQQIAPGTGLQSSVVVNTGADGICDTTTAVGDIQAATVGSATPYLTEVRCGPDKIAQSVAGGDDVQLIAVGVTCKSATTAAVDTGPNGIPDTVLLGDDTYPGGFVFGVAPANKACVIAGQDGVAQTAVAMGDDNVVLTVATAAPNTDVVLCGQNLVADTTANNVTAGDDVQVVPVGNACTAGAVVVDSGADGIASTRAEGPDLVLKPVNRVHVNIGKGKPSAIKTVRLKVSNVEFGASAPASRGYKITTSGSSCPNGVVTQIDADSVTPGLQATGTVLLGQTAKASLVVTLKLQDVTTASSKAPYRCSFDVNLVALDTAPDVDDGAYPEGNTTTVEIESVDRNDL